MNKDLSAKQRIKLSRSVIKLILFLILLNQTLLTANAETILKEPQRDENGVVTWDCVYFGSEFFADEDGVDPIKWRVLSIDGNDVFLMSDRIMFNANFKYTTDDNTWADSRIREKLQEYYEFKFLEEEKEAIITVKVDNSPNSDNYKWMNLVDSTLQTEPDTEENMYILSVDELLNPAYGFAEEATYTRGRILAYGQTGQVDSGQAETYWTRSVATYNEWATCVSNTGAMEICSITSLRGVCPVLHLDISKTDVWSYAGTVTSHEKMEECDYHNYDSGKWTKAVSCTQDGEKEYTCIICEHRKVEVIAGGHKLDDEDVVGVVYPTCTEKGSRQRQCIVCGEIITEIYDALGHEFEYKKNALGTGIGIYQCKYCDEKKRDDTPVYLKVKGAYTTLAVDKKMKLKAQFSPANYYYNTVTWSSSNPKYATVSSGGVVKAKKKGAGKTVVITATNWADGKPEMTTSYKIKIVKNSVKKITLKATKSVKAGKKVKVKATIKTTGKGAYKKLQWSVNNKKYATVNSKGVVQTKKAGKGKTITVIAKSLDGGGKRATVKIKIK